MLANDTYLSHLRLTITALRYWAPSIASAAQISEEETPHYWRFNVRPELGQACPFEMVLRVDGTYDLAVAGEEYENQPVPSLDIFPEIAAAIAAGNVFQRRWQSALTGLAFPAETIVLLEGGRTWHGVNSDAAARILLKNAVSTDHYFLPFLR